MQHLIHWAWSSHLIKPPNPEALKNTASRGETLTCHTQHAAILTSFNSSFLPLELRLQNRPAPLTCLTWLGGLNGRHGPRQQTQQCGRCGRGAHGDTRRDLDLGQVVGAAGINVCSYKQDKQMTDTMCRIIGKCSCRRMSRCCLMPHRLHNLKKKLKYRKYHMKISARSGSFSALNVAPRQHVGYQWPHSLLFLNIHSFLKCYIILGNHIGY